MKDLSEQFRGIIRLTEKYLERLAADGVSHLVLRQGEAGVTAARRAAEPHEPCKERTVPVMEELERVVARCRKCALWRTRSRTVFGAGAVPSAVLFVGEAPGAEEDRQGSPFVGRAGQLLTGMLVSIGLKREDVYITNVLKCRPPRNRDPMPEEVEQCEPYLIAQLAHIRPRLICALGRHAAQTLLKTTKSISSLRGRFHDYRGIAILPTFHPAYLLRNPADKRKAWEDLKKVRAFLDGSAEQGDSSKES